MTICAHCGKPLVEVEEVHAWDGSLYCSRECTIAAITDYIILTSKEQAIETYHDEAEVVATQEILADEIEASKECMDAEKIMRTITYLAKHSGYYKRLSDWLSSCGEQWRNIWLKALEDRCIKDEIELLVVLEGSDE